MGYDVGPLRLPLTPMEPTHLRRLKVLMAEFGLPVVRISEGSTSRSPRSQSEVSTMVRICCMDVTVGMGQAIVRLGGGQMDRLDGRLRRGQVPGCGGPALPGLPHPGPVPEEADVIVDFSRPDGLDDLLAYALDKGRRSWPVPPA